MIKKFFKGLQKLVSEITIKQQDDYVIIKSLDPANVAFIECWFARDDFTNFQFKGEVTLKLEHLNKLLKSDKFVMTRKDNQVYITDGNRIASLKEIEPDKPCPLNFVFEVGTPIKIIDLTNIDLNSITLTGLGNSLSISNSNELYSVQDTIDGPFPQGKIIISGEYLRLVKDLFVFGEECEIRFETDRPLYVSQNFGHSKIGYMIAPRVNNG